MSQHSIFELFTWNTQDSIHFYDHTDRGVNCSITIFKIIEILLIVQTSIFFTKYQQFRHINDTVLKG